MKATKILIFTASLILGGHKPVLHAFADETNESETITGAATAPPTTASNDTLTATAVDTATVASASNSPNDKESSSANDEEKNSFENMSNEELEAICTSRGFEIVKEIDDSGNERKFSRDEYIDAATQCLEIEAEMEQILNDHPHLLDEIENEAERMRKEKLTLEEQLAEAKANLELEEERIRLGDRFKDAFVDENINERDDDYEGENEGENDGEPLGETTKGEKNPTREQKGQGQEESQRESDTLNNNNENDNNYSPTTSSGDEYEEEVIDLDNCCDATNTEQAKFNGKGQESKETQGENDGTNENDHPQLAIGDGNETKSAESIITIKDFIQEFRSQVHKDFTRVADIIFPVAYREPVMSYVKPIIIVVKDSMMQVYDMVKRYTVTIFKDLQNADGRAETSSDDESKSESDNDVNEMEELVAQ